MFHMNVDTVVSELKESLLPRAQINEKALYVCLDLRLRHYRHVSEGFEFGASTFVHFVLYSPYGSSTHTFIAQGDPYADLSLLAWENTSNHDSCWRTDGVGKPLHEIFMDLANEVNRQVHEAGFPTVAPVEIKQHCAFRMSNPWSLIDVEVKRDPNEYYKFSLEII